MRLNLEHRDLLSNDLGAVAGLMFDLGSGRYTAPPLTEDAASLHAWRKDLERVRQHAAKDKSLETACSGDRTHTEVQGWLRDLGLALGFQVWIAANDRSRIFNGGKLGQGCLETLPESIAGKPGADAVRLIDVLWLERDRVIAAFEVEHTTSIYSGIVRILDPALGAPKQAVQGLFLVAPDDREAAMR